MSLGPAVGAALSISHVEPWSELRRTSGELNANTDESDGWTPTKVEYLLVPVFLFLHPWVSDQMLMPLSATTSASNPSPPRSRTPGPKLVVSDNLVHD